MGRKLLAFLVLWTALAAPCGAATLSLRPDAPARLLGNTEALLDPPRSATFEDVARAPEDRWRKIAALRPSLSWGQEVVWYRFVPGRAPGDETYALVWPGIIGRVDLYCARKGKLVVRRSGGYEARGQSLTEHVMVLPESAYGNVCYVRTLTGYFRSSPLIVTLGRALAGDTPLTTIFGGFFFAIALFNAVMYLVLRERATLIYAGVMLVLLGLLATDDALWRVVPSTPFVREFSHAFFGWLYFAGTAFFARAFLRIPRDDPRMDRVILSLTGLSVVGLVAAIFPDQPRWADGLTIFFICALLLVIFVAGVRAAQRGFRAARFFIAGSAGVFLGVSTNLLVTFFNIPSPRIVLELFEISIGWEALMLTVALADRMNDIARENAALQVSQATLRDLAEHDGLTGVPNRRAFDERFHEEWNRAVRAGATLGVIMIDVDHFKPYNDVLGHLAGDACLIKIAQTCSISLKRSGDFFARYGGEEFAAIVPAANDEDVAAIAEQMRRAVENEAIPHPANVSPVATISLGVACGRPTTADDPASLVEAADAALYEAKFGGRNRVRGAFLGTR